MPKEKPWVTVHGDGFRVHFPQDNGETISVLINRVTALELIVQITEKLTSLREGPVQKMILAGLARWLLLEKDK